MFGRKIIFLVIVLSFFAINTPTVKAATIVDWGDVVNVVYSLYEDPGHNLPVITPSNITQIDIDLFEVTGSGQYVYVSNSGYIPS